MSTVKRMFKLQKMKIDIMWDALTKISLILKDYAENIPKDILAEIVSVYENLLEINDRIDNVREKNINNFYNKLRNSYEGLYNMEVEDGKENKEEN
jgi:hypothetical protein